ncbi:MAG: hypothetical protein EZS28_046759, partial [Streblomastix strix]
VLDVDGAVFSGFTADSQYNSQGGAIYIDMRQFDVAVQFRRCVFAQNSALNGGTNIFIAYKQSPQRVRRDSFLGCYACAYSSIDQEKSFCYTIGNDNEVFIDERDSLQSSCFQQQSNDSVWFIGNADGNHTYNPIIKCGTPTNPCLSFEQISSYIHQNESLKVEVIQFCEGIYNTPQITVPSSQALSINIVGCNSLITEISAKQNIENVLIQGQGDQNIIIERIHMTLSNNSPQSGFVNVQGSNAGLILSEVRVSGLVVSDPSSSTLEPKYLFHSAGIVYLEDVVIENIFLQTGSIILAEQVRKSIEQASSGIEWLGLRSSGIYGCYFNEITTNESKIISIQDSQQSHQTKNLQSNGDSQSLIIHDSIFSNCISQVNIADTETKGGILHIVSDGIKVDIISCEFRRCQVLGRNLIYIGWTGEDSNTSVAKTI